MEKLTAATAIEILGGGRLVIENKPLFCPYCDSKLLAEYEEKYATAPVKELVRLIHQRHARIVERVWPDRRDWGCHACGRHVAEIEMSNGQTTGAEK